MKKVFYEKLKELSDKDPYYYEKEDFFSKEIKDDIELVDKDDVDLYLCAARLGIIKEISTEDFITSDMKRKYIEAISAMFPGKDIPALGCVNSIIRSYDKEYKIVETFDWADHYSNIAMEIASQKKPFWEYILYNTILDEIWKKIESNELYKTYNDLIESTSSPTPYLTLNNQLYTSYAIIKLNEIQMYYSLMDYDLYDAFGEPSLSGNADQIVSLAEKMKQMYELFYEWLISVLSIDRLEDTSWFIDKELLTDLGKAFVFSLEEFFSESADRLEKIYTYINSDEDDEDLEIDFVPSGFTKITDALKNYTHKD